MSKSIFEFEKGDRIVRIEPAKALGLSLLGEPQSGDRSYIGQKMEFLGIINGCIYVTPDGISWFDNKDRWKSLPLDIFSDGWDYWIDPKTLLHGKKAQSVVASDKEIRRQINSALADENYELADKLAKKLKNL